MKKQAIPVLAFVALFLMNFIFVACAPSTPQATPVGLFETETPTDAPAYHTETPKPLPTKKVTVTVDPHIDAPFEEEPCDPLPAADIKEELKFGNGGVVRYFSQKIVSTKELKRSVLVYLGAKEDVDKKNEHKRGVKDYHLEFSAATYKFVQIFTDSETDVDGNIVYNFTVKRTWHQSDAHDFGMCDGDLYARLTVYYSDGGEEDFPLNMKLFFDKNAPFQ